MALRSLDQVRLLFEAFRLPRRLYPSSSEPDLLPRKLEQTFRREQWPYADSPILPSTFRSYEGLLLNRNMRRLMPDLFVAPDETLEWLQVSCLHLLELRPSRRMQMMS